jgi:hypothetical protein
VWLCGGQKEELSLCLAAVGGREEKGQRAFPRHRCTLPQGPPTLITSLVPAQRVGEEMGAFLSHPAAWALPGMASTTWGAAV